ALQQPASGRSPLAPSEQRLVRRSPEGPRLPEPGSSVLPSSRMLPALLWHLPAGLLSMLRLPRLELTPIKLTRYFSLISPPCSALGYFAFRIRLILWKLTELFFVGCTPPSFTISWFTLVMRSPGFGWSEKN